MTEPPVARANRGRRWSLLSLAVFDVGGPLAVYYELRSGGASTVVALVISGILPAVGTALTVRRRHRVDVIGAVVLTGIVVGTVAGLATGSAKLVLLDGAIPTAVLAAACFGSLLTARPLMFRAALEFIGPESDKGHEFEKYWQHAGLPAFLLSHHHRVGDDLPG
jgi:drug/metabolite transporter (DMT)-like permease